MLKVFLVEDEIIMREGIKNNIQWEKEGLLFAGEASDGELAFPMIKRCKPDILITDIKMSFMDGLELSRLVRKEFPDIKIIILSGYDEFEYAKEAISIGVTEYLVKPISGAQLLETVKKVEKLILEEREKSHFMESLEKQQEEIVGRLGELSKCFKKTNPVYAYRCFKEMNEVDNNKDTSQMTVIDEGLKLSDLNVNMLDQRIVENFLKTGLKSEVNAFVDEYLQSLGECNVQSLMLRQYITMNLYLAVISMLEKMGYDSKELEDKFGDFEAMSDVFTTVEKSKKYLQQIFEIAIDLREQSAKQKYSRLLEDARNYMERHYDDEDISLNAVAASVNISPNHFSTIFSQEMGQTFIEYLTWVRMEKAKELLRSTSMKTAEVAFAVGYKDSHYFSYSFKKTQGCTPKEFRMKK